MISAMKRVRFFSQLRQRQPNLRETRELHFLRKHTDDLPFPAIDHDLLAEHLWRFAKAGPPEVFADEHDQCARRLVVGFREIAPDERLHSEQGEIIERHARTVDTIGWRVAIRNGKVECLAPEQGQICEGVLAGTPIDIDSQTALSEFNSNRVHTANAT